MSLYGIRTIALVAVLSLTAACVEKLRSEICAEHITAVVVKIEAAAGRDYFDEVEYRNGVAELEDVLGSCDLTSDRVVAPGLDLDYDTVPEAKLSILAGWNDQLNASLSRLRNLDSRERAVVLAAAVRHSSTDILASVIDAGIDPTLVDDVGNSAVVDLVNAPTERIDKLRFFVERGVVLTVGNDSGFSALDAAVFANDVELTQEILEHASSDSTDAKRMVADALDIARQLNSPSVGDLAEWLDSVDVE